MSSMSSRFSDLRLLIIIISSVYVMEAAPDNRWTEAHYRLYALKGEPLELNQTLGLLKSLNEMYKNQQDKGSVDRRQRIGALLRLSTISEDNCRIPIISSYVKLIQRHSPYKVNVLPYLHHYFAQQFNLCKKNFNDEFSESVSWLSAQDREAIDDLVGWIRRNATGYNPLKTHPSTGIDLLSGGHSLNLISESLARPLLAFMDLRGLTVSDHYTFCLNSKRGQDYLREKFESEVGNLCKTVVSTFELYTDLYISLLKDEKLSKLLDSEVVDWITKAKVCTDILTNKKSLVNEMHIILTSGTLNKKLALSDG